MRLIRNLLNDRLYGSSIWLIANSILLSGLGFLFWMVITRLFSAQEVGIASTLIASLELLVMLSLFGFDISLLRYLPRTLRKMEVVNTSYTLTLLVSLVLGGLFLLLQDLFLPFTDILQSWQTAGLFMLFLLVTIAANITGAIFIALRRVPSLFIQNTGFSLTKLLLPFLLIPFGAFGILSSWMIGAGVGLLIGLIILRLPIRPHLHMPTIKRVMRFSLTNYAANFLSRGPKWILPLIIAAALAPASSAFFYVAWTIAALLFMIPNAMAKSLLSQGKLSTPELEGQVHKALLFTFLLLVPAIILTVIFAPQLLLLFGDEYSQEGARLLQLIAISALPLTVNTIGIAVNNIQHRMRQVLIINLSIAGLIIGLSTIFISNGLIMVGYAVLAAHSLTAVYTLFSWRQPTKKALHRLATHIGSSVLFGRLLR